MDINPHKLISTSWELDMAMEDHILHNQVPFFDTLWPSYPPQNHQPPSSSSQLPTSGFLGDQVENQQLEEEEPEEELETMKEMTFKIAAMQPVDINPVTIRRPKRRNVRISNDPQSVAARRRRERISEKIRLLQRLVPGGTKMDIASMLDEAVRYVKFLKRQIRQLQANYHPPCIISNACPPAGDWPVSLTSTKTLDSATSSAGENPEGLRYLFGSNGTGDPMFFTHEIIGE